MIKSLFGKKKIHLSSSVFLNRHSGTSAKEITNEANPFVWWLPFCLEKLTNFPQAAVAYLSLQLIKTAPG